MGFSVDGKSQFAVFFADGLQTATPDRPPADTLPAFGTRPPW
jgi:hypothetical protein